MDPETRSRVPTMHSEPFVNSGIFYKSMRRIFQLIVRQQRNGYRNKVGRYPRYGRPADGGYLLVLVPPNRFAAGPAS